MKTWIDPEEYAYPDGGYRRRARALCSDGKYRIVRASIPDTFFSIPARAKVQGKTVTGFVSYADDGETLVFTPNGWGKNAGLLP